MAPPHPRGSTPDSTSAITSANGSPAPAGIDPGPYLEHIAQVGLPRTRGDRPVTAPEALTGSSAPPHPRGSTMDMKMRLIDGIGSPAPAGIDPMGLAGLGRSARLPRTRGDRPPPIWPLSLSLVAPPHPRGSTRAAGGAELSRPGSPAPAGIDPAGGRQHRDDRGLPRTRGDRPLLTFPMASLEKAPPHPRGSTPCGFARLGLPTGSPAPAGIDPLTLALG